MLDSPGFSVTILLDSNPVAKPDHLVREYSSSQYPSAHGEARSRSNRTDGRVLGDHPRNIGGAAVDASQ
jgi:hypothetical protein